MSKRKRVDKNQKQVVEELRAMGLTVAHTYTIGSGFPDFVVGYRGYNILVELKSDKGTLTTDETEFHNNFDGHIVVAFNSQDVIKSLLEYIKWLDSFNKTQLLNQLTKKLNK